MNWIEDIEFFKSKKFKEIATSLKEQRRNGSNILPSRSNLLRAFVLTPLDEVRVVILGQDPYPTAKPVIHANGLAFSVNPDVRPLPKSLVNIYKELESDTGKNRENGDLTDWAEQGVLLLNTSLSVIEGQPASHSKLGWGILANDVIRFLNQNCEHVVFILWGRHAQAKGVYLNESKHLVIKSAHPSPLSAHRGFFGSCCFSRTNKYLTEHGKEPISW